MATSPAHVPLLRAASASPPPHPHPQKQQLALPSACASPRSRGNVRPFTASGARTTNQLAVLVHFGENVAVCMRGAGHLDAENNANSHQDGEGEAAPLTSSYMALHIAPNDADAGDRGRARLHLRSSAPHRSPSYERQDGDEEEHEDGEQTIYEPRSSPFAITRVVERTTSPCWNELLLLPVPMDWRRDQDGAGLVLVVDVVQRDASQQEDWLLASAQLPLTSVVDAVGAQHVMLEFTSAPPLRVFLSITETRHDPVALPPSSRILEVLVESLVPAPEVNAAPSASFHGTMPPSIAVLIQQLDSANDQDRGMTEHTLGSVFRSIHDGDRDSSTLDTSASAPPPRSVVMLTPIARMKEARFEWQFPVVLLHQESALSGHETSLSVLLFDLASRGGDINTSVRHPSCARVMATGQLQLGGHGRPTDGARRQVECAIRATDRSSTDATALDESNALGLLHMTVRQWDIGAWTRFQSETLSRRIVSTNRRQQRRAELQALEWTGALCRGLNRYPISSFCDEGGLSSILASYLAAPRDPIATADPAIARDAATVSRHGPEPLAVPGDFLNEHVRLLQQEVVSKQHTIHTLQQELETRLNAIRTCGAELLAARKEIRAQNDLIEQLRGKLAAWETRDTQQTRELLSLSQSGLQVDNAAAQRMNLLTVKFKELVQQQKQTQAALDDANRTITVYHELEQKYSELEQAHLVQAALVQRLQQDKTQTSKLQKLVRMQEKVIQQFEKAVAQQQKQRQPHTEQDRSTALTHQDGEPACPRWIRSSANDSEQAAMLDVRVHVLEQQLRTNAKAAAGEISRLKMRVMELETQQAARWNPSDG